MAAERSRLAWESHNGRVSQWYCHTCIDLLINSNRATITSMMPLTVEKSGNTRYTVDGKAFK
jgi:hypothetical protein